MGTKTVIDINTISFIEVADSNLRCTCCGEWKPELEFMVGYSTQLRDECSDCMMLLPQDYLDRINKTKAIQESYEYWTLQKELDNINIFETRSISVTEMINQLQLLPQNARLVINQTGYYSDCTLAYIFHPSQLNCVNGVPYYSIGKSIQNP